MAEPQYDLVMPFVLVRSQGGEYDDSAYVAGWRLGQLWVRMKLAEAHGLDVPPIDLPESDAAQVDLMAMHFGFTSIPTESIDGHATFEFARPELTETGRTDERGGTDCD